MPGQTGKKLGNENVRTFGLIESVGPMGHWRGDTKGGLQSGLGEYLSQADGELVRKQRLRVGGVLCPAGSGQH